MERAIDLFNNGKEQEAEQEIINYYNIDNIQSMIINKGWAVKAYRS